MNKNIRSKSGPNELRMQLFRKQTWRTVGAHEGFDRNEKQPPICLDKVNPDNLTPVQDYHANCMNLIVDPNVESYINDFLYDIL